MSSRCTALLAEIDQRLGWWLGVGRDDELSAEDVVEETVFVNAGECIEKLTSASVACEKNSNAKTVYTLKNAWLSCVHAKDELTEFRLHTEDATKMRDLNHLKRCLDGMRERVLQQMKPPAYVLWGVPINHSTWSSLHDSELGVRLLEQRQSLIQRMNLYSDGLNSSDWFHVMLTLDSYSQFQPILEKIKSIIEEIGIYGSSETGRGVSNLGALRLFVVTLHEDRTKIEGLMKWTKALIDKKDMTMCISCLKLSNDDDQEEAQNVKMLNLLSISIHDILSSIETHSYEQCLIKGKRVLFFDEISGLQAAIRKLSIEFTFPDTGSGKWWEVLSEITTRVKFYESMRDESGRNPKYASIADRLRGRLGQVLSNLQRATEKLKYEMQLKFGSDYTSAASDFSNLLGWVSIATELNTRIGNLFQHFHDP
jgi:hypothetical protein